MISLTQLYAYEPCRGMFILQKNEQDLIILFKQEKENLLRFVRSKITGISDMDAEDIVADTLFNIYNRLSADHPIENLLPYLYQSVKNKIFDWFRRPQPAVSLDAAEVDAQLQRNELLDNRAAIEYIVEQKELALLLKTALVSLEPKQRAIWVATEIDGYSFKELSVKWQEPIGTLLARKSRATAKLRKLLQEYKQNLDRGE
ncbi:RNA polymerase sigma factor, sigma-70 family [Propionispora hippei DSM 15287]|uniref:RNA polymerase sigma factor, sigma-70 family n=2 Tax=Propionispora TaxID=112902 RepID=A0A1M6F244_9FIRM|nr:RNA polymerase sigma factor, sigma-70 family [Propionispora hippei DSM 15287]